MRHKGMILALLVFTGCDYFVGIPREHLLNAPEVLSVDGQQVVLNASVVLWKPSDGIYGYCSIHAVDSSRLPSLLAMDFVWIVKEDEVWKTRLSDERIPADPTRKTLTMTFSSGPSWEPGEVVDVIVRVRSGEGDAKLLRGREQGIKEVRLMPLSGTKR